MKKKISMLLILTLIISSMSLGTVYAGTMGSIPIAGYTDTFRIFYYDYDGYINAGSYYILPNPFDADDEYDFLLSGKDTSYVFATLNNTYVSRLTMIINVYSTSGNFIKQYSNTVYNASTISISIPPQGADRNIRINFSSSENARILQYGVLTE